MAKLPPAVENTLERWIGDLDAMGFPPRLDLLHGMATALAQVRAKEENNPSLAYIGKHLISRFLIRHPRLAARFSEKLETVRAKASQPVLLKEYFRKLKRLLRRHKFLPQDIYNVDEKGFLIGYSDRAKIICKERRQALYITQDGTMEMLTLLECACTSLFMLPPFVVYKGTAHYMGWHQDTDDTEARFAYSPNGWTDVELGLSWLREYFGPVTN